MLQRLRLSSSYMETAVYPATPTNQKNLTALVALVGTYSQVGFGISAWRSMLEQSPSGRTHPLSNHSPHTPGYELGIVEQRPCRLKTERENRVRALLSCDAFLLLRHGLHEPCIPPNRLQPPALGPTLAIRDTTPKSKSIGEVP